MGQHGNLFACQRIGTSDDNVCALTDKPVINISHFIFRYQSLSALFPRPGVSDPTQAVEKALILPVMSHLIMEPTS